MVDTFDCTKTSLKYGSKGEQVTLLQKYLKSFGYYTATVDGDYGNLTVAAVKKYQSKAGLKADGWFGPITCAAFNKKLQEAAAANEKAKAATDSFDCTNIDLRENAKGDQVKKLQEVLKTLGYYPYSVDGDFGPKTTAAVKAYQKAKGLAQDGVFGPVTCGKLKETTKTNAEQTGAVKDTNVAQVVKRPSYAPDTSKNLFTQAESNVTIDGLYFTVSSVTYNQPLKTGSWKRIDLMNGGQYTYLSNPAPRSYTVEIMLTKNQWQWLQYEFYKMQFRVCNVVSSLLDSGKYTIELSLAYENVEFRKITLALTEFLE